MIYIDENYLDWLRETRPVSQTYVAILEYVYITPSKLDLQANELHTSISNTNFSGIGVSSSSTGSGKQLNTTALV